MRRQTFLSLGSIVARRVTAGIVFTALLLSATAALADKDCSVISTDLIPLTELGTETYLGYQGGLYPGGSNEIPEDHLRMGLDLAAQVVPRNASGEPDEGGLVGLVAIGVSNTRIEFARFQEIAADDDRLSSHLVLVNGAQGSRGLETWAAGPTSPVWRTLDSELEQAGVTAQQVQVIWFKVPSEQRGTVNLEAADAEIRQLTEVLNMLSERFPHLRIGYTASRIYAGYALGSASQVTSDRAPEPKAYQHGFTMKWLVENQIGGDASLNPDPVTGPVASPWLAWGPYLWADGLTPRADGLIWECQDIDDDGVHPAASGADKVARLLMNFLSTDPTSSGWFLEGPEEPSTTPPTPPTTTVVPTSAVVASSAPEETVPVPPSTAPIREDPGNTWVPIGLLIIAGLALVTALRLVAKRAGR